MVIKNKVISALKWVLMIILWGMCISVFMGVIFRFVIQKPLVWAEEYALISMVWLTFVGAAVVFHDGQHLNVDLLLISLSEKKRKIVEIVIELIVLPFFVVLTMGGIKMVETTIHSITPGLQISVAIQYLPAVVGGLLMIWFDLDHIVHKIKALGGAKEKGEVQ